MFGLYSTFHALRAMKSRSRQQPRLMVDVTFLHTHNTQTLDYSTEDYRFRREAEEDSVTALKAPEQLLNPAYSICGRSVAGISDVGRGTEEASCSGIDEAPRAAAVAFWEL